MPHPPALFCAEALLPDGWARQVRITIEHGRFATITADARPEPGDTRLAAALPGLASVHSHAFQRGMAGLAEWRGEGEDSFWTWREAMYRFLDRMTPEDVAAVAALAYAEMLEAGFTRVGEFHYLHHDPLGAPYPGAAMAGAIADAAAETGIALTLLPVFYAHSDFGGQPPSPGQRRFVCGLDQFARLHHDSAAAIAALPDAVLGLAPHSLRAVTPEELTELIALAGDAPFHIHAAEQQREVDACLAWSGARPLRWLLDHAPVGPTWCLIHATHADPDEVAGIAASGAVAGLCPITEANLGDGVFPAAALLAAGGRFAIGTDSNVLLSAAEELRWLEYVQRLSHERRNLAARGPGDHSGAALFGGAQAGGAQALGAPAAIAKGYPADLIALDGTHPSLFGAHGDFWLDRWIFASAGQGIEAVWRGGRQVVAGGRHIAREAIAARYRTTLARLLA